jgi:SP family general alpha glucoside:H+ symporter-like MFS transporter
LKNWDGIENARQASAAEHSANVFGALHENKKAVFWSMITSLSIIMEGYDTGLMPQFFGCQTELFGHKLHCAYSGKWGIQ